MTVMAGLSSAWASGVCSLKSLAKTDPQHGEPERKNKTEGMFEFVPSKTLPK